MKTIKEHVHIVRQKPHHVRKGIAFTAAGAGAGLIALIWLGISLGTGAFAIHPTSFAAATDAEPVDVVSQGSGAQNVAGAAAAFDSSNQPAHIEIIDAASAPAAPKGQATTIPF